MVFKVLKIQLFLIALFSFTSQVNAQCGAVISTFPYTENFEAAAAWTTGGTNNDWAWGTPAHPIISSAGGGVKCWTVGGLTGSFYNLSEQAWIMSPCFDFTTLNYPWISFKIFWEDEWKYDGMVLQSSTNGGTTWTNVGAFGDPVNCLNANWYNYSNITWLNSLPAGTRNGWSGRTGPTVGSCQGGNGSLGWVTAKHCMSSLAGLSSVRFRFLFGSGTTCNSYDGISIDDIFIDNAVPNVANFTYACAGANTVNFTNSSTPCPTGYFWNFGDGTTSVLQNPSHTYAAPGTYNVTLTSSGPCNASGSITLPINILSVTTNVTNVTCNGASDGIAAATVTGSSGPFTYSWTPAGQITQTINGLAPGTYTVSITAASSCPTTTTAIITQPAVLSASTTVTPVSCFGGNNGTATVITLGGTAPYNYTWLPSGGTSVTASNLTVGTYTVSISDDHSCTTTATATIIQPAAALAVTTTNTPALCGADNGTANSTTTGGTAPYTYLWSPSGGTLANASALAAGSYTITVTDAQSCSATAVTSITNSGGVTATASSTPVLCFGGNTGTGTVTASGGSFPYTYSWSPIGGAASIASGLTAGTYTVSVTDSQGCLATVSTTITQPVAALAGTASNTSVSCFGGTDGTALVTATGGTGTYSYSWLPSGGSANTATALSAGTYTISVTDFNNCSATVTTTVAQPTALSVSTVNSPVSCYAGNNGTATVTPSGGSAPYLFSWSPTGGAAATASNLSAGTYSITVTDDHSCSVISSTIISQPNSILAATVTNTASTCGQNNGTASIIATGGTSPYTYSWAPFGGSGANPTSLAQGTYTITIADAHSCTIMINTSIANSSLINTSISLTPIDCFGGTNGTATVSVSGGNAPYSILWNTGQTSSGITNLSAGNYCATVIDAGGCRDSACIVLSNPPQINADFTSNLTVTDIYNTDIYFTDQSSIEANNWFWNFGDTTFSNSQNPMHTYNGEGVYPVTLIVTNAQGCTDTVVHQIIINDGFTFYAPNTFTPDGSGNNDLFLPKGTGWDPQSYQLSIFDRWGNLCFNTSDHNKGWDGKANKGSVIAQVDVYIWKVQVADMSRNFHYYIGSVTIFK